MAKRAPKGEKPGRHVALVVEDDKMTAEEVQAILEASECDSVAVSNKADALKALRAGSFCAVVLDLQIHGAPDSIKGHAEHGRSLLRELRERYPEHVGACHRLPVVVVSSNAAAVDEAVSVMRDGADDVIQKGTGSRVLSEAIRRALERSGRTSHEDCGAFGKRPPAASGPRVTLAIPGDRDRLRVRVTVGDQPVSITEGSLVTLLRLMVAHAAEKTVHKNDMGGSDERGFKGVWRLREELKPVPGAAELIENDYHGNYWLSPRVVLGGCDAKSLRTLNNRTLSELAGKLEEAPKRGQR